MHVSHFPSFLVGSLVLASLGGCSAIVDSDKKQCETTADCAGLFGADAPFQCTNNYCVSPACTKDSDCTALGFTSAICGSNNYCRAGCTEDANCAEGELCVLETHKCQVRACSTDTECQTSLSSNTAICQWGQCTDPVWGCIGLSDNRPVATMPTASYRIQLVKAGAGVVPVTGATAVVCPDPVIQGLACSTPVPGARAVQDAEGWFTVTGLPQNSYVRLMITPPATSDEFAFVDYYSQMPIRDSMTAPAPIVMVPAAYLANAGLAYQPAVTIDRTIGGLYAQAFDCEGKPARGFSLEIDSAYHNPNSMRTTPISPTAITYFSNGVPSPGTSSATDSSGFLSVINLPPGINTPLLTAGNGKRIGILRVQFAAMRTTVVHFYPRDYNIR